MTSRQPKKGNKVSLVVKSSLLAPLRTPNLNHLEAICRPPFALCTKAYD